MKNTFVLSAAAALAALSLAACSAGDAADAGAAAPGSAVSQVVSSSPSESTSGTLFDVSSAHTVSLDIDQDALDELLSAYRDSNDKTYAKASINIDGVTYKDVGVRLKGNSTLRSLGGGENAGQGPEGAPPELPEGLPENPPEGMEPPVGMPDAGAGGMAASNIDESDSSTWPLLINFDKYVDGQTYNGLTQLALRAGTPSANEAAALAATALSGQASQRFGYATYSVNGSATQTRLFLENPDETYAASLGDGYLFKADSESSFSYQGDDVETYKGQFKLENDVAGTEEDAAEQHVVDLLKWLDGADDAEFDAHLADYVDVDSFARYLATQNLLVNTDDMAGPGQNYYLWYDNDSKKFSVISWDLDNAMRGQAELAPEDTAAMGGGGQAPGGGIGRGNELKQRFLASATFQQVYQDAYWELYDALFASGDLSAAVDGLDIPVSDGLSQEDIDSAKQEVQESITQRADYLNGERA